MYTADFGDPGTWVGGVFNYQTPSQSSGLRIVLYNESPYHLTVNFNGDQHPIPAWWARLLTAELPVFTLTVNRGVALSAGSAPISDVALEIYEPGEPLNETYPVALVRQANIGNQVVITSAQSILNDGQAAGSSIAEATPAGQGVSSWSMNNDASGFIQVLSANVLRKILNVIRGDAGATKATVVLGDAGDATITTLNGNLAGGVVQSLGGQASAGSLGAPVIVAQALDVSVTSTAQATILSYTPTVAGVYRVNVVVAMNGSLAAALSLQLSFVSPFNSLTNYFMAGLPFSGASTPELMSGSFSWTNSKTYAILPAVVELAANQAMTVKYTNPSGIPADHVSVVVERLA